HCLLARVDALRPTGPFDEGLVAAREHSTLSLQVRVPGGEIWLEPSVVVRYPWPKRNTLADYRFYLPRGSDEWAERSFRRFHTTPARALGVPHGHRPARRPGGLLLRGPGALPELRLPELLGRTRPPRPGTPAAPAIRRALHRIRRRRRSPVPTAAGTCPGRRG